MPQCPKCGVQLPEDENLRFCPNCGARIRLRPAGMTAVMRDVSIGIFGAFLSAMILLLSPPRINLYFIPSFLSAILVIYLYRINDIRDALIVAFSVYLFTNGILGAAILGSLYLQGMPYNTDWIPQLYDVILYTFEPISAFIAGYIGVKVSPARKEEKVLVPTTEEKEERLGGVVYSV